MRIAAIGTPNRIAELRQIVSSNHEFVEVKNKNFQDADLVIDLNFDDNPNGLIDYAHLSGKTVIIGAVKHQLEAIMHDFTSPVRCCLIGMNTLPTFINRDLLEMTATQAEDKANMIDVAEKLGWNITWVDSRVGMVTPRVIMMIINEAYYTYQEGTANKEDIDIGMKLGTAYPFGPFEWSEKIGIKNVYQVLKRLFEDTGEGRYKICPALKTAYLKSNLANIT